VLGAVEHLGGVLLGVVRLGDDLVPGDDQAAESPSP